MAAGRTRPLPGLGCGPGWCQRAGQALDELLRAAGQRVRGMRVQPAQRVGTGKHHPHAAGVAHDGRADVVAINGVAIAPSAYAELGGLVTAQRYAGVLGFANVAGSFFSAYPSSGSFNRSGVNLAANAQTPLSAIAAALFLVIILAFVSPLAEYLPYAVVAALLLAVAWNLIDVQQIRHEIRSGPREWIPMVLTGLGTILISLEWAILAGICVAAIAKRWPQSAK